MASSANSRSNGRVMNENEFFEDWEDAGSLFECQTNPPQRILFADDDKEVRRFNVDVLMDSGYEVHAVEDGATAWDALQLNSYDLLITDNNMPKVTGIDLCRKLHAAHMAVPVILTSGLLPVDELRQNPWLPVKATLLKPYTLAKLLGKVGGILHTANGVRAQLPPPTCPGQPLPNRLFL